jgi:putative SOS response-associated peptidase YedK
MCGRYALTSPPATIAERFRLLWTPEVPPHYNIAPSQMIPVVREMEGGRELVFLKWGLVPRWARDAHIGARFVNVRAETLGSRFRDAYRRRRCLVPADGFYEWAIVAGAARKQPYHLRLPEVRLFALGAIWEPSPEGPGTCAILTTEPTDALRAIHDRMPVVVPRDAYGAWLDLSRGAGSIAGLLRPFNERPFEATPVGFAVNDASFDGPACIHPAS